MFCDKKYSIQFRIVLLELKLNFITSRFTLISLTNTILNTNHFDQKKILHMLTFLQLEENQLQGVKTEKNENQGNLSCIFHHFHCVGFVKHLA